MDQFLGLTDDRRNTKIVRDGAMSAKMMKSSRNPLSIMWLEFMKTRTVYCWKEDVGKISGKAKNNAWYIKAYLRMLDTIIFAL